MAEEVQDNIEVQPIDEPAPQLPEEAPTFIEAPKPKRRAKAKPRAKKEAQPPPPPIIELERQEANVETQGETEPVPKKRQTRRKSTKSPPDEEMPIAAPQETPVYPTTQQIAMYLQNQKLLKMQKRQSKVQQLVAAAF